MMLCKWDDLPEFMRIDEVRKYYDILDRKRALLFLKKVFDMIASLVLLIILSPLFLILAVAIKIDSPGPVFYRQIRITQYGKPFRIHKFRSMIQGADKQSQVTLNNDSRVTRVGAFIRKYRLDEISQLIDILQGNMTFVGTRPEVPKYVDTYAPEMLATLLLPAGVTSEASIFFKDEAELLNSSEDADKVYSESVLPGKMQYNLMEVQQFSIRHDFKVMFMTVLAVFGIGYKKSQEIITTNEM